VSARLDPERLDHQLALRGLRQRDLAQRSGVAEATLSRARGGRRVSERTLSRIAQALESAPVLPGRGALLVEPGTYLAARVLERMAEPKGSVQA
jgi:transcriptional regulator with XRE-family HTH domain